MLDINKPTVHILATGNVSSHTPSQIKKKA